MKRSDIQCEWLFMLQNIFFFSLQTQTTLSSISPLRIPMQTCLPSGDLGEIQRLHMASTPNFGAWTLASSRFQFVFLPHSFLFFYLSASFSLLGLPCLPCLQILTMDPFFSSLLHSFSRPILQIFFREAKVALPVLAGKRL